MATYGGRRLERDLRFNEVRARLGRLCIHGVEPYWVREEGGILLDLECVQKQMAEPDGDEDARAVALIELLRDIVGRIRKTQHGLVLWIVLALDDEYLGLKAEERQAIAGREFRDGRKKVTWGTIRQYHLPRALDRLTHLLLAREGPDPGATNAALTRDGDEVEASGGRRNIAELPSDLKHGRSPAK
jgi:hypothetical protein